MSLPFPSVLGAISVCVLSACGSDSWEGFVYADKNDLTRHLNLGKFNSLDECRAASRDVLAELKALEAGDYECGRNCDDGSRMGGIKVCEETIR